MKFVESCVLIKQIRGNKYLCYNSFSNDYHWFWGKKNQSEIFALNSAMSEKLLKEISNSELFYIDAHS